MTNRGKIRVLAWVAAIIAMFIVTLMFAMAGSNHMFTAFFITSFMMFGFGFSVCEEEDEGQH